ncbi:MAG: zinc ribbon domain-containing protein [Nitrospirae bacterium]|nr:zinc ribbon domain-containing protein [Nitrospirota bacterium]
MPIYEYKCQACEKTFEIMQKINDPPLTSCMHCSGHLSKIISPSGLVFKGSGWYITDYSSKGKEGKETKKGKEAKPSPEGEKKTPTATAPGDGSGTGKKTTSD